MSLPRRGQGIASIRAMVSSIGIGDALQLDLVVFDHGEGGARIAVARQSHAPRVEDHGAVHLNVELHVGVAHADDVGSDVLSRLAQVVGVLEQVLVERVAGRGVDQQESLAAQVNR